MGLERSEPLKLCSIIPLATYLNRNVPTDFAEEPFFLEEPGGIQDHFRHHYFQIALIAHYQKASLLAFLDDLSETVAALPPGKFGIADEKKQFQNRIQEIDRQLAEFTTRYWFPELSNQIQPRELFDMWMKELGTNALYDRVMQEVGRAQELVYSMQSERQTQATLSLTFLAALAATFGVTTSFFAMQIIVLPVTETFLKPIGVGWRILIEAAAFLVIFSLISKGLFCAIKWKWLKRLIDRFLEKV
jgi:hypothetical protein